MVKIFAGSILLFVVSLFIVSGMADEYSFPQLVTIAIVFWPLLCLVGSVLIAMGYNKLGKILIYTGAVPFVPLGLLPIIATRNYFDQLKSQTFEQSVKEE